MCFSCEKFHTHRHLHTVTYTVKLESNSLWVNLMRILIENTWKSQTPFWLLFTFFAISRWFLPKTCMMMMSNFSDSVINRDFLVTAMMEWCSNRRVHRLPTDRISWSSQFSDSNFMSLSVFPTWKWHRKSIPQHTTCRRSLQRLSHASHGDHLHGTKINLRLGRTFSFRV